MVLLVILKESIGSENFLLDISERDQEVKGEVEGT